MQVYSQKENRHYARQRQKINYIKSLKIEVFKITNRILESG